MAREFVADIRNQGDSGYLTFVNGYRYQQIIEAVRGGAVYELVSSAQTPSSSKLSTSGLSCSAKGR